ncbi:response regulator transcription factor [Caminibacter pacificus]|uniref:DNA-binding response OmpR family regulator n=1 Tax=Caminibacter pacificus TaxID=1424653 RepID=A0AAJ4RDY4_9BACT|nr:response regulator transcription factor [Caminibacter pacificus]NPA87354.1 response regulator transcription factor [Campylobacterota bacterium]QCI28444.1 response regulator transcription factor [Caminibacter pacificus]ROR40831.1 DNA-binding response OmpR family regulator [Caminibacter pacificus]
MKILLLEDDFTLADTLKEVLESEGFEVDIANNAQEAYEKTYNEKYDLYIFDINLPDENGIEVLKNLRDADDETPTIYITALTDLNTMSKAFDAGADDFIKKPFEPEELLIRLKAKLKPHHDIIKINDIEYDPQTKEVKKNGKIISLGFVLKDIFHELITNKNKVVPKDRLLELTNAHSDATLRVNITKLKNKLGIDIKNIRGEGYTIEL